MEKEAELFINEKYGIAEAPFYVAKNKRLSWVDILAGKLYMMDDGGDITSVDFGQMIGAAVPIDDDSYMVAAVDGLYKYSNGNITKIRDLTDVYEPYQRSNDAKFDPKGRLWFGATVYDGQHEDHGNLFSFEDGNVVLRQPDTKLSNGMAWNKEADKFYFSDSEEHKIFVYDYDNESGNITNRKTLFEVTDGVPDGMTIDSKDNLWVAVWGGNRLEYRDGKTGEKLDEIYVPAKQVSSCCFYGSEKSLFITTAGVGLTGEYDGCLFICEL
ncbi:MAG: SMP-30/gluconolactonase/LRE family protein [Lachnospiraceae bacterium]|nr:SMP-30/gluconolactonase/LRE family protein [Lachnospiraceae bacterium]